MFYIKWCLWPWNTFVQLTEGRSARDLPKQRPAKKRTILFYSPILALPPHGTNIATPASLEEAPIDTLAGNQLCQWSSIGASADSVLLASHLTVHLSPRIGAYVLANYKTNASLVPDTDVAGQNSLQLCSKTACSISFADSRLGNGPNRCQDCCKRWPRPSRLDSLPRSAQYGHYSTSPKLDLAS